MTRYSLQLRSNGNYYFRKRVPASLINKLGKSEVVKSLKTTNKLEALKKVSRIEIEIDDYFSRLLEGGAIEPFFNKVIKSDNDKSYTLKYLAEGWIARNNPSISSKAEWNLVVSQFTDIFGEVSIKDITLKHIIEFKEIISGCPARYSLKYPEMKILEVYKKFKGKALDNPHSVRTISKKISAIKTLLNFAVNEGLLENNVASSIKIKGSRSSGLKRNSFSEEDLRKIFNSDFVNKNNYKFWIAYIALYTGARLEEIGQLTKEDIREEGGIYYFDINTNNGKKLKTKSSVRKIPIHNQLIKSGLLDYINSVKSESLFPELKAGKECRITKVYSQWFSRYLQKIGICDSSKVYHSYRLALKRLAETLRFQRK